MSDYRDCIVSFFDILGFSEMVTSKKGNPDEIAQKLDALLRHGKVDPDFQEALQGRSYHFSDTVVRVTPLDSPGNRIGIGLLFHEILDVVHLQMELVKHAVMIRGAITVGKVRFSEHQVFGPGVVRAYYLESQMAQFPRIVVDPEALSAIGMDVRLRKDTHSADEERTYIRKMLRKDTDGLWFVDYLRAGHGEANDDDAFVQMLGDHRDAIADQIRKHPTFDRTGQKLAWIAQYHNRVLREFERNGLAKPQADELMIDIPEMLVPLR